MKKVQKNDYITLTCIQFEIIIEISSEFGEAKYNGGIAFMLSSDTNSLTNFNENPHSDSGRKKGGVKHNVIKI